MLQKLQILLMLKVLACKTENIHVNSFLIHRSNLTKKKSELEGQKQNLQMYIITKNIELE